MALPGFHPLTSRRWSDLVQLFGARGACGGCWCMEHRLPRREFELCKGAGAKRALRALVDGGQSPGLLGYLRAAPIAWVSVGPRARLPRLATSRILRPLDEEPVWSINCLFIRKDQRCRGVSTDAIRAAVQFARAGGARIVEAYPVEPRTSAMPPVFAFTGILSSYERAGFREVARRSTTRPIVRRTLRTPRRKA